VKNILEQKIGYLSEYFDNVAQIHFKRNVPWEYFDYTKHLKCIKFLFSIIEQITLSKKISEENPFKQVFLTSQIFKENPSA